MELTCQNCGRQFTVPQNIRERYPGWEPRLCASCHGRAATSHKEPSLFDGENLLSLDEVLATYSAGPTTGVFTDGSSVPNPGPGGWGAVYVVSNQILDQAHGHETFTTNNRMELTALVSGIDLIPEGTDITIYTDSNLAFRTFTEWASGWEARGWKRKSGPIQNLDLVRPIYEKLQGRPELSLEWIAAHSGYRWNEYADALASLWLAEA